MHPKFYQFFWKAIVGFMLFAILFIEALSNKTFSQIRLDRSIIESLQDIVALLEEQLRPLVQAESSVLVDILYRPEMLFPASSESRSRCESGGFIQKLVLD